MPAAVPPAPLDPAVPPPPAPLVPPVPAPPLFVVMFVSPLQAAVNTTTASGARRGRSENAGMESEFT